MIHVCRKELNGSAAEQMLIKACKERPSINSSWWRFECGVFLFFFFTFLLLFFKCLVLSVCFFNNYIKCDLKQA